MINGESHFDIQFWDLSLWEQQPSIVNENIDMLPLRFNEVCKSVNWFAAGQIKSVRLDRPFLISIAFTDHSYSFCILLLVSTADNHIVAIQKQTLRSLKTDPIVSACNNNVFSCLIHVKIFIWQWQILL